MNLPPPRGVNKEYSGLKAYLPIVAPYIEPPGGGAVFLDYFNSGHKAGNTDVIMTVFREQEFARQFHFGCVQREVA